MASITHARQNGAPREQTEKTRVPVLLPTEKVDVVNGKRVLREIVCC